MPHNTRLQVPPGEVWKFQKSWNSGKSIDWNALVKVSDISHVYGIHEKCDEAERSTNILVSEADSKQAGRKL